MPISLQELVANQRRRFRELVTHSLPPAVPNAFDDEFNDLTVDPAWATYNWGFDVIEEVNGVLHLNRTTSHTSVSYLRKAFAPVGDFSLSCLLTVLEDSTSNQSGGIFIADAAGNALTLTLGDQANVYNTKYTGWNSWSNNNSFGKIRHYNKLLRIRRAGANYIFEVSYDGDYWFTVATRATSDIGDVAWAGFNAFKNGGGYVNMAINWIRHNYTF